MRILGRQPLKVAKKHLCDAFVKSTILYLCVFKRYDRIQSFGNSKDIFQPRSKGKISPDTPKVDSILCEAVFIIIWGKMALLETVTTNKET